MRHTWSGRFGSVFASASKRVFLAALAALSVAAQTTLPPLPRLALDSFPPETRDVVVRSYQAATARPQDVAAVGALARMLHAWNQWGAAHETYARAQALAPRAFEWLYLDGLALQQAMTAQGSVRPIIFLTGKGDVPTSVRARTSLPTTLVPS